MSEGTNKNYTDEYLISKMKEDINMGLALIMEQYAGLIWTVCSNYLQNPEDIKECVNDTFAKFALDYERFKVDKGSLRNYLCKIAEHCAVDKFRYNMKEKQKEDTVLEKISWERTYGNNKRELELLDDALEQLEPVDSQILRMKYYDGLSFKEVAENLHMDYEVVKKRSQRSYKKLLKLILLGLLLGILAACAAIVFKQYRFSELIGFIWNVEKTAYGLKEETESMEVDGVSYRVTDAVYYNGELQIEITAKWLGQMETDWSGEFYDKISDFMSGYYVHEGQPSVLLPKYAPDIEVDDMEFNRVEIEFGISIANPNDTAIITINYEVISARKEQNEIYVTLIMKSGIKIEFELIPLPLVEYEGVGKEIQLPDKSVFVFGANHAGDDNVIIDFSHMNPKEYEVSPLISNNYQGMGTWNSKTKNVVLIDKDGNEISTQRIKSEDSVYGGIRRNFQLFFPHLDSGTYTLQIPYLCLLKEAVSETISLELPTVDGEYKACDKTVLFEDGSGYRIMGIRCEKNMFTWENKIGNDWFLMEETEWQYYLTYETISTSNLEFCFAEIQGIMDDGTKAMGSTDVEGNYYFSIKESSQPVVKQPSSVEIYFQNPVYVLDEKITTEIILQEE